MGTRSLAQSAARWPYLGGGYILSNAGYIETLEELYFNEILDRIIYDSPVTKVDYSGARPVAIDANGVHHYGDVVLLTVSVGVLQSEMIDFAPNLSSEKVDSYSTIGMGHGIKLFLKFDETFWDGDRMYYVLSQGHTQACWTPGRLRQGGTNNIFTCFIMGDHADFMSSLGEAGAIEEALADLDEIFDGEASDHFVDAIVHDVTAHPYLLGAYSYPAPGTFPVDNSRSMREILSDPVYKKVYFAGEATNNEAPSTVIGALKTGRRAGGEIHRDLSALPAIDASQCYAAKPKRGLPKPANFEFALWDRFQESAGTAGRAKRVCAPSEVTLFE